MAAIFNHIVGVDVPVGLCADASGFLPETNITVHADGEIPFPQIIIRDVNSPVALLLKDSAILAAGEWAYRATVATGVLRPGHYQIQAEGCRVADISRAGPDDWIKSFRDMEVAAAPKNAAMEAQPRAATVEVGSDNRRKLYFGIHKHMHQPYYRAADPGFHDGGVDEIFATRAGAYRHFINMAVSQYQQLPYAGLSMSWSGSLFEQLDRASREGLAHGAYSGDWKEELRRAANMRTSGGHPRAAFSAFGFFHPLMALIPPRNIKAQILRHREFIEQEFGIPASTILFPPETVFHVRMIPALLEAGIEGVIYDSIHRYRSCMEYPYAGREEGMLPPNRAEQENPAVADWLQLHNVWAGSKISPSLLRPEYIKYTDVEGAEFKIVGIPAERYIGNEDARGGFGALVYPDVLGQVLNALEQSSQYDPAHPPFFLLHSDGDNYGGGTDSYYGSNTGAMVEWLKGDPRFELTTVRDYLDHFPPDPANAVHIEPGSWSGADNGDPQFMKWFSGYNNPYSPDLNSWAVLTALQNAVHTLQDARVDNGNTQTAERLMLTAETRCYWYWTGQDIWDSQVTEAANAALGLVRADLEAVISSGKDTTGPTIFAPWVTPENPGGKTWGNNCLADAGRTGIVHTFIHDVSGLRSARLFIRTDAGKGPEREIPFVDKGRYPTRTGAVSSATLFEAELPEGIGDIRYWIEAADHNGNISRSALERVFLA